MLANWSAGILARKCFRAIALMRARMLALRTAARSIREFWGADWMLKLDV
jgi:hypothetical protein